MTTVALRRWFERPVGGSWGESAGEGECDALCIRGTDLDFDKLDVDIESAPVRGFTAEDIRRRSLQPGDLVIEKSGGGDTQPVGRVGLFSGAGVAVPTNFAARLRPRASVAPRFAAYRLASLYFAGRTRAAVKQTTGIQNLDLDELLANRAWLPPLAEQRAIADYLDAETARIDALIAKKQQLIHLLEERWRAALTMAVAPDGVLSTAGRWPTAAFGAVVQIAEGQIDPRERPWSDMVLIAPNHVESGTGRLIERETASEQGAISGKYRCSRGDVIYSKIRPALVKAVLAEEDCLCSADMYPLRPGDAVRPRFLLYLLLSPPFTEAAVLESDRVAMPKINRDALGRVRVPLPSTAEQDRIIESLDRHGKENEQLRSKLARQLDLLTEHRRTLITAAVAS